MHAYEHFPLPTRLKAQPPCKTRAEQEQRFNNPCKTQATRHQGLQTLCRTQAKRKQSLKPYAKQEQHETKALQIPCKTIHKRDQIRKAQHKARATCTSGLAFYLCLLLRSTWLFKMNMFYMQHQPTKQHVPIQRNHHFGPDCVQRQGECTHMDVFHRQRDNRLKTPCKTWSKRDQSLNILCKTEAPAHQDFHFLRVYVFYTHNGC